MSFRSRSARGSAGSNTNNTLKVRSEEDNKAPAIRRQRTLLSQTSWRSMTFVPNLMRSLSTSRSADSSRQTSREEPRETDCGLCGCWSPEAEPPDDRHDYKEYDEVDQVVRERPEEIQEEDEEQIREEEDEERIREEEDLEKIRKEDEIVAEDSDADENV